MVETSPANKQILRKLLSDPGNKTCADCKTATHPRWASWNIGIFLCIRCSGVHRSLGTHISKVRSVDLDSWTDAHLVELQKWGNKRANLYWEAGLQSGHIPDESKIVNFIRTKYELRRWVGQSLPEDVPLDQVLAQVRESKPAVAAAQPPKQQANLLDFDDFASAPPVPTKKGPVAAQEKQPEPSRYSRTSSATTTPVNAFSMTGPKTTASSSSASAALASVPAPRASAAAPTVAASARGPAPRADLKKSILSLYAQAPAKPAATPSASPSTLSANPLGPAATAPPQTKPVSNSFDFDLFTAPKTPAATGNSASAAAAAPKSTSTNLIDDLSSLSFSQTPSQPSNVHPAAVAAPAPAPGPTASQGQMAASAFTAADEDDFFDNPWRS